jgi:hypothetical protein
VGLQSHMEYYLGSCYEALYRMLSSLSLIHAEGLMKTLVCLYLSSIVNVFQFEMNLDLLYSIIVEMECQV